VKLPIAYFSRLVAASSYGLLLAFSLPLAAQTPADSSGYVAKCASCHSLLTSGSQFPPLVPSQNSVAVYGTSTPPVRIPGKIFSWIALNDAPNEADFMAAMLLESNIPTSSGMHAYFATSIGNASVLQLRSIYHYLRQVRDAEVSISSLNPSIPETAVGLTSSKTVTVNIYNYRATALNYKLDIAAVSATIAPGNPSASEFSVTPSTGTCVGTDTSTPTTCTINVTVTFKPQQPIERSATMNVVLESASPEDLNPGATRPNLLLSRRVALVASGIVPLTVSVDTTPLGDTLSFTTVTNVNATQSIIVGNKGNTDLTITPTLNADATTAKYTIASASTCTPGKVLPANSGTCTLTLNFLPITEIPTSNAKLSIGYNGFNSPRVISLNGTATAAPRANIQLSAQSASMGEILVGSSAAPQTITVHNAGQATLQLNSIVPAGAAQSDFVRSGTCNTGTELQVGPASNANTNCTIELIFRPSEIGPRNAKLVINSNAIINPVELTLSGTGKAVPAPRVEISPGERLDFGLQTTGGIYPVRGVTLKNTGDAALSISPPVIEGAAFTNASTAPCPGTLASGASCTIDIRFNPTAAGTNYTGTLRINSNAAGSPHSVALVGSGTATAVPVLEWTAPAKTELDFGLVSAGTVSATQSVSFINRGPGGVTLSIINAIGTDAAAFAVDISTCPVDKPLFQDTPCRIDIKFSPGSGGTKTAVLQIVSSGSAPATLKLTGTGLGNPAAGLALSTSTMVFEAIRLGAQSVPVELTLSGTGAGSVTVTGLQVSGPFSLQRKTCAAPPFQLNAGSSCTMTVTFQPQAEGNASGTLRVTSDATPAVSEIALNGSGQAQANLSSGGCSIASGDTPFDPTLWALVLLAIGAIAYRRRVRAAGRKP
jgi:MYXO-CTERM domain-containing protein